MIPQSTAHTLTQFFPVTFTFLEPNKGSLNGKLQSNAVFEYKQKHYNVEHST